MFLFLFAVEDVAISVELLSILAQSLASYTYAKTGTRYPHALNLLFSRVFMVRAGCVGRTCQLLLQVLGEFLMDICLCVLVV